LRKFARQGAPDELDLDGTIRKSAREGYLDIVMRPERRNTIKVLLFFDVGGSMDPHIRMCEELFSAARSEFKHMEYFYFHNCVYEGVWKDNRRRNQEKIPTWDVLHKYPHDYKVVIVGDATMSPYEITYPGGSVEHWNEEPGALWLYRLADVYERLVWLNPSPRQSWDHTPSVQLVRDIIGPERMYPLTLSGLEGAMRELNK
ncbi:MAG: VWA domain-containing protein, partial [Alphaproteobacteria bacterium]|nr:VWA domain-containing protein [Alphaproteobacteria bacterium]